MINRTGLVGKVWAVAKTAVQDSTAAATRNIVAPNIEPVILILALLNVVAKNSWCVQ